MQVEIIIVDQANRLLWNKLLFLFLSLVNFRVIPQYCNKKFRIFWIKPIWE